MNNSFIVDEMIYEDKREEFSKYIDSISQNIQDGNKIIALILNILVELKRETPFKKIEKYINSYFLLVPSKEIALYGILKYAKGGQELYDFINKRGLSNSLLDEHDTFQKNK